MDRVIYVVDVGSPRRGLAWARLDDTPSATPTGSAEFALVPARIAADIRNGSAVALGFEAPAFVPVPIHVADLARARTGEVRGGTARPWSYGAGAYAATMAIQLSAWLLREIRTRLDGTALPHITVDAHTWGEASDLLLWEAFVSGDGHARGPNARGVSEHIQDAATAAIYFREWLAQTPRGATEVSASPCISTLGASAIWAGWSKDVGQESAIDLPSLSSARHRGHH